LQKVLDSRRLPVPILQLQQNGRQHQRICSAVEQIVISADVAAAHGGIDDLLQALFQHGQRRRMSAADRAHLGVQRGEGISV